MASGRLNHALRRLRGQSAQGPAAPKPASRVEATLEPFEQRVIEHALQHSITSRERVLALVDSVRYICDRGIDGAFAECGVWRGGSIIAMILTLQDLGAEPREIYLYDTFEGMSEPTEEDTSPFDPDALDIWKQAQADGKPAFPEFFDEEIFNLQVVKDNVLATGYPEERLHFVKGKVEDTIPGTVPDKLALLRLDTDWYESTKHELIHLYPRLSDGGVLIIDDYGHWEGARKAVDEYFASEADPLLLSRIDYTGRIGVKR